MKETEMEWRLLANHLPPEFIALSAYRCEQRAAYCLQSTTANAA
jgi:hypothetical protein